MSGQQTNIKYTAHYPLEQVRKLLKEGRYEATLTARKSVRSLLKVNMEEALDIIYSLEPTNLDKSMTDV